MTSPESLHSRCSLKPWHHPIVPFPSLASPANTLLKYLRTLWHTGIMVLSTKVMPVHFPKACSLMKSIISRKTLGANSTKRLYETASGKQSLMLPLMQHR